MRESAMQTVTTPRRVLLFIRAPELGRVKTRLEIKMDAVTVLGLYQCFVEDIIQTLSIGGYDITVYFAPSHKVSAVQAWLGPMIHVQAQKGRSLGEKMCNAFSNVFTTEVDQAVLIGSDFPDLAIDIIHQAFVSLQNSDVTIGPAKDGGYYLMGFRKDAFNGDVFTGIDWGTEHVYQQTRQHIHDAGLNDHVLPSWQDIDTYEDLSVFYHRSKANGLMHLKTMQFLSCLKLKGFQ